MYTKSVDFLKKKLVTSWIRTYNLLNASSCSSHWAICAVVFNGMLLEFSLLLCLQPAAKRKLITASIHGDKIKVRG